jgi:hypothetical protein
MRMNRYAPPALAELRAAAVAVVFGAILLTAATGCGGSSSASPSVPPSSAAQSTPQSTPQSTTPSKPPPRVALRTPQGAVQSYLRGIQTVNGNAICNSLDENVRQAIIQKIVRARPTEAGAPCAQALAGLAAAITTPSEAHAKLPALHATVNGATAVVRYTGKSHEPHTFTLVKSGPGWLIDRINNIGG